jgi:hypothetical protein
MNRVARQWVASEWKNEKSHNKVRSCGKREVSPNHKKRVQFKGTILRGQGE